MPRNHTTRSYWRLLLPLLVAGIYLGGGCTNLRTGLERWVEKTFGRATLRERYVWSKPYNPAILARWDTAYFAARRDTLSISLPHLEAVGADTAVATSALAWRFWLPPGRLLRVMAGPQSPEATLFGELYRVDGEGAQDLVASWDTSSTYLSYENRRPEEAALLLVTQSAPYATGPYEITFSSAPALLFPVAGGDAGDIRSFWGASRDGGRRSHEGNDIFAPRGTPLLATTDGRISRVKIGGLGGKTVWLRDGERRLNYYYAHLDSQLVTAGQYVSRGDTIGLVGNTGNARTTPPHLHFGIYAGGARDPLPYLLGPDAEPIAPAAAPGTVRQVPTRGRHYLRVAPAGGDNVIRELQGGEAIRELATTGRYHRVRTQYGETGYVNFD